MASKKDAKSSLIIKKISKKSHGGHHGGSWKIAYADFVTAMMAFFLLMWLLNATSEEQKRGIANYFNPISVGQMNGGSLGVMGGTTIKTKDGSLDQVASPLSVRPSPLKDKGAGGDDKEKANQKSKENVDKEIQDFPKKNEQKLMADVTPSPEIKNVASESDLEKEHKTFEELKEQLQKEISKDHNLKDLLSNLIIDETDEGLRIQIIDQDKQAMFPNGSSRMYPKTQQLLAEVAKVIQKVTNKISISGHTDANQFQGNKNFSNWELSAERANASRRVLKEMGVSDERFDSVVGKADTEPFNKDNPLSPQNRRISILLLKST